MRRNRVKELLKEGKPAIGTFLVSNSRAVLEVLAAAGLDFVIIDAEHFMLNPETIEQLVTAAEAAGITPFVRVQENVNLVARALDCGAMGIVAPMIETREQAELLVETAKYLPVGRKGVCNPRAIAYGVKGIDTMVKFYKEYNDEIIVMAQIETKKSVDNAEEIARVKGIDALMVGPMDMSQSLGIVGQFDSPVLNENIDKALATGKKYKMPMAILSFDGESSNKWLDKGFNMIVLGADVFFLMNNVVSELSKIKQ
jgi:2-keto-3-deoxy-L-rhamnonate aldolase RhmA